MSKEKQNRMGIPVQSMSKENLGSNEHLDVLREYITMDFRNPIISSMLRAGAAQIPGINLIGGAFGNGMDSKAVSGPMLGPWQQPDNTGGMSLDSIDRTGPKKNGGKVDSLLQRYGIPSFLGAPREPINREFDIPEGSFPTPGEPDYFPPDEELV